MGLRADSEIAHAEEVGRVLPVHFVEREFGNEFNETERPDERGVSLKQALKRFFLGNVRALKKFTESSDICRRAISDDSRPSLGVETFWGALVQGRRHRLTGAIKNMAH
jgi:hypothetical protein